MRRQIFQLRKVCTTLETQRSVLSSLCHINDAGNFSSEPLCHNGYDACEVVVVFFKEMAVKGSSRYITFCLVQ